MSDLVPVVPASAPIATGVVPFLQYLEAPHKVSPCLAPSKVVPEGIHPHDLTAKLVRKDPDMWRDFMGKIVHVDEAKPLLFRFTNLSPCSAWG